MGWTLLLDLAPIGVVGPFFLIFIMVGIVIILIVKAISAINRALQQQELASIERSIALKQQGEKLAQEWAEEHPEEAEAYAASVRAAKLTEQERLQRKYQHKYLTHSPDTNRDHADEEE